MPTQDTIGLGEMLILGFIAYSSFSYYSLALVDMVITVLQVSRSSDIEFYYILPRGKVKIP
jgi:hypothetical protein